jgi:hypothetical protein
VAPTLTITTRSHISKAKVRIKAWLSRKTIVGLILLIIAIIPRWVSIGRFWFDIGRWLWLHAGWVSSGVGRITLIVLGFFLIWLDHRRFLRKHTSKPYDLTTLRGRTLKLRDDIKTYWENAGQPPYPLIESTHQVGYIKHTEEGMAARASRLLHGYEIYFASDVVRTYHEYGELGWSDTELQAIILRPYKNDECYRVIIDALGRLADQTAIMEAHPDLGWSQIANMTLDERRRVLEGDKRAS